jgi:hypothetical protein
MDHINYAQIAELMGIHAQLLEHVKELRVRCNLTEPDPVDYDASYMINEELVQVGAWTPRDCYNLANCVANLLWKIILAWTSQVLHPLDQISSVPLFAQLRYHRLITNLLLVRTRLLIILRDTAAYADGQLMRFESYPPQETPKSLVRMRSPEDEPASKHPRYCKDLCFSAEATPKSEADNVELV